MQQYSSSVPSGAKHGWHTAPHRTASNEDKVHVSRRLRRRSVRFSYFS